MIGVPGEDALGAVELLGQQRPGRQVRTGCQVAGARQPCFNAAALRDIDTCYVTGYSSPDDKEL